MSYIRTYLPAGVAVILIASYDTKHNRESITATLKEVFNSSMKNISEWKPTKFFYRNGRLGASRNTIFSGNASKLIIEIVARFYDVYIKQYAKGRLIDLGCGMVPLYEAYRDYVTEIVCVDWEHTSHTNKFVDFECDLNEKIPFGDEEFNTIILSDVLEHIAKPANLWEEMFRILQKDGHILMNVPFYYWIHESPYDYYRYTEHILRRFVEANGFSIVLLQPIGGSPEIMADILAKNLSHIPFLGKFSASIVQDMTLFFIKTIIGQNISNKTSRAFPLGYFLIAKK